MLPALAALVAVAAGLLGAPRPAGAAIVEEIVAKVNNRIISKSEFEERGAYILRQLYQQFSGAELDKELRSAQESLLANMITELLLLERAETLLDLDKVRKNLIEDFRKQQSIPSDADLESMLKEQGMTRADLEEQLVRLAIPQEIINYEVKRKISVSDKEVEAYYDSHAREWEAPATVTLREIVLFYEAPARAEAETRARGLERELQAGADFEELVARSSEAGTKDSGGLLGPLPAADLHPRIAAVAFDIPQGKPSGPIDTGRSFHILKVEARTPQTVKTILEVHDAIYDTIRQEKFGPRYDAYLKRIWKESHVEVMPKYSHFLTRTPLDPKVPGPPAGPRSAPSAAVPAGPDPAAPPAHPDPAAPKSPPPAGGAAEP